MNKDLEKVRKNIMTKITRNQWKTYIEHWCLFSSVIVLENKKLLTKDQSKIKQSPFLLPLFFPIWIWPPNEPLLLELRFNAHIKHFLRTLAPLIH